MNRKRYITVSLLFLLCAFFTSVFYGTADESDSSVLKTTNQLHLGNIAVAHYNSTDGVTLITNDGIYSENTSSSGELTLDFTETTDSDFLRSDENGIYLTGTYDNSAVVFYVRQTESGTNRLQIAVSCIDEKMYFASIGTPDSPEINTTLSLGIYDGTDYCRKIILTDCTETEKQYITIDYTLCPYDESKDAYQIVLCAEDGMACFTGIELTGLELVNISGEKGNISYRDGVLADSHDASANADYLSIREQMSSVTTLNENTGASSLIKNFLLNLYEFILRMTTVLRDMFVI